nr:PREDICTED: fractalkine-like [Apteryx mantelli mantelli]
MAERSKALRSDHRNMKTLSLQVLFVLRVLYLGTLTEGQPKAHLKCSKECGRFTSRIPEERIKSYRRTEPQCTKQGIIFITQKKSWEICADPREAWVKKVIWKLDQKKASAASPLPHAATSAAVPEAPGVFHKHVGLTVAAPSQAAAPTSTFQGAGTTILDAPTLRTEVSSKPTPAVQYITQFSTGSSPVIWEIAAHSEMSSEANRDSTKATAHSTTYAAGTVPSHFLSRSQMHFVIPVSLVGGLIVCSAAVWLYKKLGIKKEAMPMEMVQGLLYQQKGHQANVYPVEVI